MATQNSGPQAPLDAAAPKRGSAWIVAPVVIFLGMAALFGFALVAGDPSKLPSALIGKPVPKLEFAALEGLSDAGKPVPGFSDESLRAGGVHVVNFWASWCAPCIDEHPLLMELRDKSGVPILGVNYKDPPDKARRFLGRYGNPFAKVGTDASGRGAIEWGVYGTPETFIVNGQGEIVYKHVGPISKKSLETVLLPMIEQAKRAKDKAAS